ncbi:hypothetical protein QFZ77_006775 [Paenibacillus sp. V4I3]|uniref:hypothetical protein n=1 Tax=unclassified Paenibacillus TaxID=185978 RepID=UPI00277DD1F0|nr:MULTISPECIES: hypothetical protein [unclassified Paenibacillus]MDQ0878116.1 hypothetical protein [Paenibacillus sp. V4I3]MDQ0886062.1 hypothetical protein [Paenibacillus sp. V4I9]
MAIIIMDIGSSIPSSGSETLNREITTGGITLALFGLATTASNRVILNATVSFASLLGAPEILFTMMRDTAVIFTARGGTLAVNENRTTTLHMIDTNVPTGYHAYRLLAQEVSGSPLNQAQVTGPVTYSGVSYEIS